MRFGAFSYGSLAIDGATYGYDLVLDRGELRKRRKKPSKAYREAYGHTPVSLAEGVPWECRRLVIGTGLEGALPVMPEVEQEARRRGVELVVLPTEHAIALLGRSTRGTNAILHVTC